MRLIDTAGSPAWPKVLHFFFSRQALVLFFNTRVAATKAKEDMRIME